MEEWMCTYRILRIFLNDVMPRERHLADKAVRGNRVNETRIGRLRGRRLRETTARSYDDEGAGTKCLVESNDLP
ncbi:hypothetical protein TNCV_2335491 [Trichonephila clavipes]|uniref:Uncharacterized protein n=1 Tax=Trichonephila clavipes TaxID=2585209 RepID=A0A8X6SKQ2_TRICX|nr:hypothetical protein TNCV_2335491 [Trichonephila clavipes]